MESPASSSQRSDGERKYAIMEKWRSFFNLTNISDRLKNRYALGKLVQISLIQYLKLRGVYSKECFMERAYEQYEFVTLNLRDEEGARLNKILITVGKFIDTQVLKALRFRIFHDQNNPHEIVEELLFQFKYVDATEVVISFGSGNQVKLNMTDCSFEAFLQNFSEMLETIRSNCIHLEPLPEYCEKVFKVSFYSKPPANIDLGDFKTAHRPSQYAPDMVIKQIGVAYLPGVATAAILRTCYAHETIETPIDSNAEASIFNDTNETMHEDI